MTVVHSNRVYCRKFREVPIPLPPIPQIVGIDPGLEGAILISNCVDEIRIFSMPVKKKIKIKKGSRGKRNSRQKKTVSRRVDFFELLKLVGSFPVNSKVYLERAMPLAMGSKHAFNYGRDFEKVVIALQLAELDVTQVEPRVWTAEMHRGLNCDLKPKARSLLAVEALPHPLVSKLPRNRKGALLEGPVDALLIAWYGHLCQKSQNKDFF